ncbi:MAG TPA: PhzF family phenazine biosynthesis protein [Candidatus Baltobacteraceae bacterium]|jgi:trans-2,3-dihydro-3-hydroxyanthranilate isomerase|nr:PhzF family phenazine biosynthesis protein [Candidatus Baltobacteraceae bacterium]
MRDASYMLFDVFTDVAFAGNQLAVFPDVTLDDATMQRIARELNLAETVFLNPADDVVASLRIFTPLAEVPFAGHPTIGAAVALVDHLWWVGPNETEFVLREKIGDVPIRVERGKPTTAWLTTPPVEFGRAVSREDAAAILGLEIADVRDDLPCEFAGAGNIFLYVALTSKEAVDRAVYDTSAVRKRLPWSPITDVYLFAQSSDGVYARMFAPMFGIAEDPATGSATGPLFVYLARHGRLERAERLAAQQGVAMGRPSVLHVKLAWEGADLRAVDVGGNAIFMGEGKIRIP